MREIKFRAWDNVKDQMYFVGEEEDVAFEIVGGKFVGYDAREEFDAPCFKMEHLKVMQYTGLKDKNGVEIYEGDVVEFAGKRYLVEWEDYMFNLNGFYEPYLDIPYSAFSEELEFEVVGNAYEHPRLLEARE